MAGSPSASLARGSIPRPNTINSVPKMSQEGILDWRGRKRWRLAVCGVERQPYLLGHILMEAIRKIRGSAASALLKEGMELVEQQACGDIISCQGAAGYILPVFFWECNVGIGHEKPLIWYCPPSFRRQEGAEQ